MIGIYAIRNIVNNKIYIGLSTNIEWRFIFHKRRLRDNSHKNKHLQTSYNKYGVEAFEFLVLEECVEEILSSKERQYIEQYKSHRREFGYNKTYGGEFGKLADEIVQSTANKLRGRKLSEEMKERIRKTLSGRKQPQEAIDNRAKSCTKYQKEFLEVVFNDYLNSNLNRTELSKKYSINKHTLDSLMCKNKIRKHGKQTT